MKKWIFSIMLGPLMGFIPFALANEDSHGEAKKAEEGHGEKKEEGHGAPAAPVNEKSTKQEIMEIQNRVNTLRVKIKSKQDSIEHLIEAKQHTKDDKHAFEIVQQMKVEHKELTDAVKEYDQQRALLKYRYPERGREESKQYERIEVKDLEDMEKELGLEGQIHRSVRNVKSRYKKTVPAKDMSKSDAYTEHDNSKKQVEPSKDHPLTVPKIISK